MNGRNDSVALADVAAAILNGTPIDWPAIEANASQADRELLEELRLLCTVADLHRSFPAVETEPAATADDTRYWGRLRLIERVGGGSFGDVYRAWDPRLHREVALKLIAAQVGGADRSEAIIREGRLLARVRHPGVATIYDAERIGSLVGLSMEFVEGPTLEQRIREHGVLTIDETTSIALQLCDALSAAHDAGVLHRDVKAANVIVKGDGRVVLMDFGAGRELAHSGESGVAGTPLYLAPEVLRGGEATVRSDIYALGVLLHYLRTRSYPVIAKSLRELEDAHAQRRQTGAGSAAAIEGPLGPIIARATAPDPRDRYESAAALAAALRSVVTRTPSRWRQPLMAVAATVLLLAGGWWLLGMQTAPPVRIAVMPFEVVSAEPDAGTLQAGLLHGVVSGLQRFENTRVISAASALSVDALRLSAGAIRERLGVSHILTGRITRTGDEVAAEVTLTGMPEEQKRWSRTYRQRFPQRSQLQSDITEDLARELRLTRAGGVQGWPTVHPAAHAHYIKGREALDRMSRDSSAIARQRFEEAVRLDPDYAEGYAGLAEVYSQTNASPALTSAELLRRATAAADRAMELNPQLPAAHVAAAIIRSEHGDWAGADRAYRRALELGPGEAAVHSHYAHWLARLGRFDEAIEHAQTAQALDPLSARAVLGVASAYRFARQWEAAIAYARRALEVDPGFVLAYLNLGHSYEGLGLLDEAIAAYERRTSSVGNLGAAYAKAGRIDDARRLIATLEAVYAKDGTRAGEIAQIYCGLGDIDRAFEWLEREGDPPGGPPHTFKVALVWDPLRHDPRFQEVLRRHHLLD